MKNLKMSTLIVLFSAIVFLFTAAFTLKPSLELNKTPEASSISCFTCTPEGPCVQANYCGMSECTGDCDLTGTLCDNGCDMKTFQ
ncbi:MAG: hypothetical protein WD016_05035 [Balneolaceae bacterium]